MRSERSEEEGRRNLTLIGLRAKIKRLSQLRFRTALAPLLMLRKLRKYRNISIELALAGTSGAAPAAVGRPWGIGAVGSGLSQYMRRLGPVQACVILVGAQLSRLERRIMATILRGYLLL